MSMRSARDTFLMMLKDGLPGLTIHNVRFDVNNPEAGLIKHNAINVEFLNSDFGASARQSRMMVIINVCNDDELTAVEWAQQVADILREGSAQKMDYTDSSNPVALEAQWMSWNPASFRFAPITDEYQYRLRCMMNVFHRIAY